MMILNLSSLVRPLKKTQLYLSHRLKPIAFAKSSLASMMPTWYTLWSFVKSHLLITRLSLVSFCNHRLSIWRLWRPLPVLAPMFLIYRLNPFASLTEPPLSFPSSVYLLMGLWVHFSILLLSVRRWWMGYLYLHPGSALCSICSFQSKKKRSERAGWRKETPMSEPTFDCDFFIWTSISIAGLRLANTIASS